MNARCGSRRPSRRARALALAALAAVSVTGCKEVEETAAPVHEPAVTEEVDGLETKRVRFDEQGAEQVSLRTARVVRVGQRTVVPYAAVIYDQRGVPWVYTEPEPRSFVRHKVAVDRIDGDRAWLSKGPQPGVRVVTVGATEVYGAELDIAGGH